MPENIVVNSPSEEGKVGSRCFNIYLDEQNSPQGFDFGSSLAENKFWNSERPAVQRLRWSNYQKSGRLLLFSA